MEKKIKFDLLLASQISVQNKGNSYLIVLYRQIRNYMTAEPSNKKLDDGTRFIVKLLFI
jgi:hypothetical protein